MPVKPKKKKRGSLAYRIRGWKRDTPGKSDLPPGKRAASDFAASIAVCGLVGLLADRAFGTSPWCFLGSVFLGFVVGLAEIWHLISKTDKEE